MILLREKRILTSPLKAFDYNPDNRCGAVASAILLKYYYDNVTKKVLPSKKFNTSNGRELIEYINSDYVKGLTDFHKLTDGLNAYLKERGLGEPVRYMCVKPYIYTFFLIRRYIRRGLPVIVKIRKHSNYNSHWGVANGYRMGFLLRNRYIYLNDGYGKECVTMPSRYISGAVYIDLKAFKC